MNRLLASLAALAVAAASFAGPTGIVGTRSGGDYTDPAPGTGVGFGAFVQMLLALVIVVFILKAVLPRIAGKLVRKTIAPASGIQIEESAQFAGGNLYIISARGKTLLVSATAQGVQSLAELAETASPLQADPFEIALSQASGEPDKTVAELEVRETLEQLRNLHQIHAR